MQGAKFHDLQSIAECLVIGNQVVVTLDPEWNKEPDRTCDGIAYACHSKGVLIGYLPLLRTLRKYMAEAYSEDAKERVRRWGLATKAIRQQLKIDHDNACISRWTTKVAGLIYKREGDKHTAESWLEFQEYSDLCHMNPDKAKQYKLTQVAINFEGILDF